MAAPDPARPPQPTPLQPPPTGPDGWHLQPGASAPHRRRPAWAGWVVLAGAVATVAAAFLPWLGSGSVDRTSFQALALLDRLTDPADGLGAVVSVARTAWPLVVAAVVLPLLALVLRARILAGVLALVLGVPLLGTAATAVLAADGLPGLVTVRLAGPIVLSLAGVAFLLGGVGSLLRSTATPPPPPVPTVPW